MKNLINLKSKLLLSLSVAGSMFLFVSCENKSTDSNMDGDDENTTMGNDQDGMGNHGDNNNADGMANRAGDNNDMAVVIDNDNGQKFLMEVAEMQYQEISLGKLAQTKGTSAHVKALGKMMEADHTKTLAELKTLAQSKSFDFPTTDNEDSRDLQDDLMEKEGNEFGKAYSEMMVEHHEDAIEKFEDAATNSEDAEIKAWAAQKLPGLRTHLDHAKKCKEECDRMDS